tara:strand:+ start:1583 stop:2116 length:534 start_codon:yes stop_codon:yes gene_type:complete
MRKTKIYIYALLAAAMSLNIGCTSSMSNAYDRAKSMIPTGSSSSSTDALYAQVNTKDRGRVDDLSEDLDATKKIHEISKLEEDRDDLQRERSRTNREMLTQLTKEKSLRVQLAKLEAIDKNKLGTRIDNIEAITDVHVDAIDVQQKRLKLASKVSILDIKIVAIEQKIETLTKEIEG